MRNLMFFVVLFLTIAAPSLADAPVEGRAGRAELRFLEGMADHHQMALDMAGDCLLYAESAPLKVICQQVIEAQSAEIAQMSAWLLAWYNIAYAPVSMLSMSAPMPGTTMPGMDHSIMPGMNTPATDPVGMMGMMAGLNRLSGQAYDVAWIEAMLDHHDDAIHMSERFLNYEAHAETRILAETIISAQSAESAALEALLVTLSN